MSDKRHGVGKTGRETLGGESAWAQEDSLVRRTPQKPNASSDRDPPPAARPPPVERAPGTDPARGAPRVARSQNSSGGAVVAWLETVGDFFMHLGTFIVQRVVRPVRTAISSRWQVLSKKMGSPFTDRVVDSDTYDPDKARNWEKFRKGKRSSSYLPEDEGR